jgi:hypothetical protein
MQRFEQVAVLAAQVDEAELGAKHKRGHRHAFDHRIGLAHQQHAILERAGLAFVGVADNDTRAAFRHRRGTRELPLLRCREAGAAAAAQTRCGEVLQRRLGAACECGAQRLAVHRVRREQHVGAPDLVIDHKPLGRPVAHRRAGAQQIGELDHPQLIHACQGPLLVDEHRGPLVAEADARGKTDTRPPVGAARPIGRDAELPAQGAGQVPAAGHAIGDVVAEQQVVLAHLAQMEEAVEAGHALHDGRCEPDALRHLRQHLTRQPARALLHLAQDLHQRIAPAAVALQDALDDGAV